ncbi:MAG: adenylyl-sulfate kinase [Cytophagales bacterium]|nr:adenylyl-sulfate kinase [Cytophagales bacterium]MDW8383550.1 adenylyl-sulfate kinase [Flammeovirgaceae bacterium]
MEEQKSPILDNIFGYQTRIRKQDREYQKRQKAMCIWFTGLSGSGKSTLANALEQSLFEAGFNTYILDGDNIRLGLNKDLTFSEKDRRENIRRIGEVAKLFVDAGIIVITAFISPFEADRQMVRNLLEKDEFLEIFVDCPLEVCEQRDVKGLYKKARAGLIKDFTGIGSPFEVPQKPDLVIRTHLQPIETSVNQLLELVLPKISLKKPKPNHFVYNSSF